MIHPRGQRTRDSLSETPGRNRDSCPAFRSSSSGSSGVFAVLDGRALNGQLVSLILAALDSIAVFSGKVTVVPVSGNTNPSFSDLEVMVAAAQPLGVQLCWRSWLWRLKLPLPIDSSGRGAIHQTSPWQLVFQEALKQVPLTGKTPSEASRLLQARVWAGEL